MADTNTPPDWVLIEAAKRSVWHERDPLVLARRYRHATSAGYGAFAALCDMILKHEQPPVDPDVEALIRVLTKWHGQRDHDFADWADFPATLAQFKK